MEENSPIKRHIIDKNPNNVLEPIDSQTIVYWNLNPTSNFMRPSFLKRIIKEKINFDNVTE